MCQSDKTRFRMSLGRERGGCGASGMPDTKNVESGIDRRVFPGSLYAFAASFRRFHSSPFSYELDCRFD